MNINDIKKLVEMFKDSDLSELKVKEKDKEIKLSRGMVSESSSVVIPQFMQPQIGATPQTPQPVIEQTTEQPKEAEAAQVAPEEDGTAVVSPMVGTFYEGASPNAPPFISVGDQVKVGDVLCIIEAMKIMNQIQAEVAGTVTKIAVKNADPVEYGQTLFVIK